MNLNIVLKLVLLLECTMRRLYTLKHDTYPSLFSVCVYTRHNLTNAFKFFLIRIFFYVIFVCFNLLYSYFVLRYQFVQFSIYHNYVIIVSERKTDRQSTEIKFSAFGIWPTGIWQNGYIWSLGLVK